LKDYREKEMKYLMITYVLLFLFWSTRFFRDASSVTDLDWNIILSAIQGVIISGVLSLITFISDSLFSSNHKDKLVGLFFIPRSGCTVFSRMHNGKIADDRFTKAEAREQYSHIIACLPSEKKEKYAYENAQWYKIYCQYQDKGSIVQAQKDYLLCRDLFIETIIFIILYLVSLMVFHEIVLLSSKFIITLIIMAILTNIATHKKMNRFVNNVIATDIAFTKGKK
jgi:hypothetical protein